MKRFNITTKIWLSIGVFVLGFVIATVLGQIQGRGTEDALRITSQALFPAAQQSQEATSAFQRASKGFSDAVLIQDAKALEKAVEEGGHAVEQLNTVAAIPGLAAERAGSVRRLSSSVEQFVADARKTYGGLLANPESMNASAQARMGELATRTDQIKDGLQATTEQFSKDLRGQLSSVATRSAQQRWLALVLFGATIVVAFVIVNLTIRRAITGPILHVIQGVQAAATGAAEASERVSSSGDGVAKDAQDQAAYIQETSASLEEISATTKANADRAAQADKLMQEARQTVQRATQAMDDLISSMDAISKSSKQVAGVLKSIDDIAFHTNILALNAAVEAARAGEAGAGFSVVADEVRSLAHRAAEAAQNSADIIERTIADVKKGVSLVSLAHNAFSDVSKSIAGGSKVVGQIAASSDEQSRGVTHIGQAISRMETVTQNNAANAREAAEAASAMTAQVQATRNHLEELVSVVGMRHA